MVRRSGGKWACYIPESVDVAYPLWSTNADQPLLLRSGSAISFGMGYHDNPDIEMIAQTPQGLLADLLNRIWESEATEEEMREAAQVCGFKYLAELREFVNSPELDGLGWQQRRRQFLSEIDAKKI